MIRMMKTRMKEMMIKNLMMNKKADLSACFLSLY